MGLLWRMPPFTACAVYTHIPLLHASLPISGKFSPDNFDLALARSILDEDHYGMTDVKGALVRVWTPRVCRLCATLVRSFYTPARYATRYFTPHRALCRPHPRVHRRGQAEGERAGQDPVLCWSAGRRCVRIAGAWLWGLALRTPKRYSGALLHPPTPRSPPWP